MDIHTTANTISQWPSIVGPKAVPAKVVKAVELFDAAEYVEEPFVGVDPGTITGANLEAVVSDLTEQLARQSQFSTAKQYVREVLGRHLIDTAADAVDDILDAIRPEFDKQAKVFTEAVQALPEQLDATTLIRSGVEAVTRYGEAVQAQQTIAAADRFLATLVYLGAYGGNRPEPAIRVLAPFDRNTLQALVNAQGTHSAKLGDLSPLYVKAVQIGVPFALNTPDECTALRREIEAMKFEPKPGIKLVNW